MYKSAANKTGKEPCAHSHGDVISSSVCSWRRKFDFVLEIDTRGKTVRVFPRMSRAEWKAARAQKNGAPIPRRAASAAAPATRSKERAAPGPIGIGKGGVKPRKKARPTLAANLPPMRKPAAALPEPTGLEPDHRCEYYPGERYLMVTGAPIVVRSAFVVPSKKDSNSSARYGEPKWFKGPAKGPFASFGSGTRGVEYYEWNPKTKLPTPEAVEAYSRSISCPCCERKYERDAAGKRTAEAGCWFCTTYHRSPSIGSGAYTSWALITRAEGLLRCPSYRATHAEAIERADDGPALVDAKAAHARYATLPMTYRSDWPQERAVQDWIWKAVRAHADDQPPIPIPDALVHGLPASIAALLGAKAKPEHPSARVPAKLIPVPGRASESGRVKPAPVPIAEPTAKMRTAITARAPKAAEHDDRCCLQASILLARHGAVGKKLIAEIEARMSQETLALYRNRSPKNEPTNWPLRCAACAKGKTRPAALPAYKPAPITTTFKSYDDAGKWRGNATSTTAPEPAIAEPEIAPCIRNTTGPRGRTKPGATCLTHDKALFLKRDSRCAVAYKLLEDRLAAKTITNEEVAVAAAEATEIIAADIPSDDELAAVGEAVVASIAKARDRQAQADYAKASAVLGRAKKKSPEPAAKALAATPVVDAPSVTGCIRDGDRAYCKTHKAWMGKSERRCESAPTPKTTTTPVPPPPANVGVLLPAPKPASKRQAAAAAMTAARNALPVGEDVVSRDPRTDCEASERCSFRASHRCPQCRLAICNKHARTQADHPKLPRKCEKCHTLFKDAQIVA